MKKIKNISFKKKLLRAFIVTGIIPLLFMALASYYNTSTLIKDKINSTIVENLEITSRIVDSTMRDLTSIVTFISDNEEIQQILGKKDYNSYEDRFQDVQRIYKITSTLLATEKLDVPIYITGKGALSRFSTTENFAPIYSNINGEIFKSIDGSEGSINLHVHRRVDGKDRRDIVLAVGKQIRSSKDSEKLGYVVLDVYDDYFNDIFKSVNVYSGNNIYILDKTGTIITDKLDKNLTGFRFDENYVNTILNNKSGSFYCTINGQKSMVYYATTNSSGIKIVETVPIKVMYKDRTFIVGTFMFLLIFIGVLAVGGSLLFSKNIAQPINNLSKLMKKVEAGDRTVNFRIESQDEIGQLGNSFNNMLKEINRLIEEVYVKQYLLKEAEFKALKAQVNPHFLYNTLESINWMAKLKDTDGVTTMVTTLGKFLRYSISSKGDEVTVKEDIDQVINYITIQKLRYGDKFSVTVDINEDIYNKKILKLLLQPLVENALVHGIEQKRGQGELVIKGYQKDDILHFDIIDDGVGPGNSNAKGEGIGMENVNNRIQLHYGDEYGVNISRHNNLTVVSIIIPDQGEESEEDA